MASTSWSFDNTVQSLSASDIMKNHRAEVAREADEKAKRRRLESAELRSSEHSPEMRIRAWEKLHDLHLPTDPSHPVLDVIAVATRLTLEQVLEEQRARAARKSIGFTSTMPDWRSAKG